VSIRLPTIAMAIAAILSLGSSALGAEVISGEPRIVDGDTVQIGSAKIRFDASTRRRPTKSVSTPKVRSGHAASPLVTS